MLFIMDYPLHLKQCMPLCFNIDCVGLHEQLSIKFYYFSLLYCILFFFIQLV